MTAKVFGSRDGLVVPPPLPHKYMDLTCLDVACVHGLCRSFVVVSCPCLRLRVLSPYKADIFSKIQNSNAIWLCSSPGSLSILITMLRHNMAAISEIADFRTRSALFVICSVILTGVTNWCYMRFLSNSIL